jgi:hypothetical protein
VQIIGQGKEYSLYQLKESGNFPSDWVDYPTNYKFTSLNLVLDFDVMTETRQTLSLLDCIGNLGGLWQALIIIF